MDYEEKFDESFMRPRNLMRFTMHNLIYRIAHNKVDPSRCGYCLHGSGCNSQKTFSKSWKDKTRQSRQYK